MPVRQGVNAVRRWHAAALMAVWMGAAAYAQDNPEEQLKSTQAALERAKTQAETLKTRTAALEKDKAALARKLVEKTAELQRAEKELLVLDDKLAILERQANEKEAALAEQRSRIEAMVQTAIRLSSMPPEAAVMMPGDTAKAVEAARAVRMMAESIRLKSEALQAEMRALLELKNKVEESRADQARAEGVLRKESQALDVELKARAELFAKTSAEADAQARKARQLAQKSEDLKGLLAGLEQQRRAEEAAEAEARARKKAKARAFAAAKGGIRAPAAGKVIRGDKGAKKGLTLHTLAGARVTAPFDGEVVFTGPFLNYGPMVILRHEGGYHSLLAGLQTIDVKNGQVLLEGEPVGRMGGEGKTQLYFEIRKDNIPIDPSGWVAGLAK